MNVVIKNIESNLRDVEVENVDCVYDVCHLSLLIQMLEMIDDYKRDNNAAMPGTITDLVEWNNTPHEEIDLPFN